MLARLSCAVLFAALVASCASTTVPDFGPPDAGPVPRPDVGLDDGVLAPLGDPDGDTIANREEGAPRRDTDADGTPDYLDLDSDGDTILDRDEAQDEDPETEAPDWDGDGIPDFRDLDADDDGWGDAEEAGDADLDTAPVDSDDDGLPDYLDLDSDSDGLTDRLERELGSDRLRTDTDGDGFSDLREVEAGTDPTNPRDNPTSPIQRGELTFVVPLREEPMPTAHVVEMRTAPRQVDLYLLLDVTASMADEVEAIEDGLGAMVERLSCPRSGRLCTGDLGCADGEVCGLAGECVEDPAIGGCVEDPRIGLGTFAGGPDRYRHRVSPEADAATAAEAIPDAVGADGEESLFEAAACVADPAVCFGALCDPALDRAGCGGLRLDALRILAVVTDAANGCLGSGDEACEAVNSATDVGSRLRRPQIEVLGIDTSGDDAAREDLGDLGRAARSLDGGGDPHVRSASAATLLTEMESGIRSVLASQTDPFLDAQVIDRPDDDGDALTFVRDVTRDSSRPRCSGSDGVACWQVTASGNARLAARADRHRVFVADLFAFANGAVVDRRPLYFVIPQAE